jgi:hypothetical protein
MAKKYTKKYSTFLPHKDSTSLLLEWLPSRTQTTTNAGKDVGKKEPSHIVGEDVNE